MKRIVCFHLFNDYSGSPKVLRMVLGGLLERGWQVELVSSKGGVLDELLKYEGLRKFSYPYRFSNSGVVTMLRYSLVQLYTFFLAFRWMFQRDVVFYVNTILPVGPALAGRIMGKEVVYHYHENAFVKGGFYRMLAWAMEKLADEIICVSDYQASFLKRKRNVRVISNALSDDFVARVKPSIEEAFDRKRVLMLGSLKLYKGPLEFIELADRLPQYSFELVVNDTQENIDSFLREHKLTPGDNLTIFPRQDDVVPFYNRASLVLNLSNRNDFIETFGLTALEAMRCALPVIVPTVGGIAELVDDGVNGYKIDIQDFDRIETHIAAMLWNKEMYMALAENALYYSRAFSEEDMVDGVEEIL